MIRFKFLSGDVNWMDYGGKWISQKLNNGDFDYFLVLELLNMDDACGRDNEGQPKYHVCVAAVSPHEAGEPNVEKALEGYGDFDVDDVMKVEALHTYGISAPVYQKAGNNALKLMKEARKEAQFRGGMLFGFSLDKSVNKIGTTGWEALRGDMDSALRRTIASGTIEGNILKKIHGL